MVLSSSTLCSNPSRAVKSFLFRLQDRLPNGPKIIKMAFDNISDNFQIELPVIMHRNIAEANHGLEEVAQGILNNPGLAQHIEGIPSFLTRIRCMAASMDALQVRCRLRIMESWRA